MPNYMAYQKSISDELISIKDRVRNFIDGHHWGEDGRYKEIILSHTLRQHLPKSVSVGTGFVVRNNKLTKQIDIIVYRNDFPLMFKQDDFIIAPSESVLGIIEVKSRINTDVGKKAIRNATENGRIIGKDIFNGVFAFESKKECFNNPGLRNELANSEGVVNHLCFGADIFLKYWETGHPNINPCAQDSYAVYQIQSLAFGYFISNLIEDIHIDLHNQQLPNALNRMFYPIEETKEAHKIDEIAVMEGEIYANLQ